MRKWMFVVLLVIFAGTPCLAATPSESEVNQAIALGNKIAKSYPTLLKLAMADQLIQRGRKQEVPEYLATAAKLLKEVNVKIDNDSPETLLEEAIKVAQKKGEPSWIALKKSQNNLLASKEGSEAYILYRREDNGLPKITLTVEFTD
jgi:hypothetical protein